MIPNSESRTLNPAYPRWPLWIILALALVLRLAALYQADHSVRGVLASDGQIYHVLAKNILLGRYQISLMGTPDEAGVDPKFVAQKYIFSTAAKDQPTNFWSPGYPAFVAFWYAIFGPNPILPLIAGAILGTVCCFLLYKIGDRIAGPVIGLVAALFLAAHPIAIRSSVRMESETLGLVLVLLGLNLVLAWRDREGSVSLPRAVLLGLLFGLTFYVRSTFALLPGALILSLLWGFRRKNILSAAVIGVVMLLVILPWGFRNQRTMGNFTFLETRGANFLYGDFVAVFKIPDHFPDLQGTTELERWKEQKGYLSEAIKARPGILLDWARYNITYWFPFHRVRPALILVDFLAIFAVLYGMYQFRRDWFRLLPVLLFIALYYGIVLMMMKGYEYRFHLPTDILLTIFLAAGLIRIWQSLTSRYKLQRSKIPGIDHESHS